MERNHSSHWVPLWRKRTELHIYWKTLSRRILDYTNQPPTLHFSLHVWGGTLHRGYVKQSNGYGFGLDIWFKIQRVCRVAPV